MPDFRADRSAFTPDGRARPRSVAALCLSSAPPFLGTYAGQRLADETFGHLSAWNPLLTLTGALLGALVSVALVVSSGVLADIKAHEVWLAIRSRYYEKDERPNPE
ncbi:MAG: hypothetical protein ACK5MT_03185 [Actinomycetales bacterium]